MRACSATYTMVLAGVSVAKFKVTITRTHWMFVGCSEIHYVCKLSEISIKRIHGPNAVLPQAFNHFYYIHTHTHHVPTLSPSPESRHIHTHSVPSSPLST